MHCQKPNEAEQQYCKQRHRVTVLTQLKNKEEFSCSTEKTETETT